jgi:hypothetical protein
MKTLVLLLALLASGCSIREAASYVVCHTGSKVLRHALDIKDIDTPIKTGTFENHRVRNANGSQTFYADLVSR